MGNGSIAGASVQPGRSITLQTDALTLQGFQTNLSAPGGTVAISPFTAAEPILLTTNPSVPGGTLGLSTQSLRTITAATLQLGALDPNTGVAATSTVTLGNPGEAINLTANGGFTTLKTVTSGAVTEGGALTVNTLTGQAGSLNLPRQNAAQNAINNLVDFTTTTGDVVLYTGTGLTVTGNVVANRGAGTINLTATGQATTLPTGQSVNLQLDGNLNGGTVNLVTATGSASVGGGINQAGGTITAGTLTGFANFAQLTQPNQIANLGTFETAYDLTVSNGAPLRVTGTVTSDFTAVTLNANGITQTPASSINAAEFDGSSIGDVVLASTNNAIRSIGYFAETGNLTLASSQTLNFGGNSGLVSSTGGLTFIADNVGLVGGTVSGGISAPNGVITFAPLTASRRIELIGATAADTGSLSLSQAFLNRITAGPVLALGMPGTQGDINIANPGETVRLPNDASLNLQTTGNVTEGVSRNGANGGGTLALVALDVSGAAGSIALAAPANQISYLGFQQSGSTGAIGAGSLTATNSLDVFSAVSLTAGATISANAQTGTLTLGSGGTLTQNNTMTASAINLTSTGNLVLTGAIATGGSLDTVSLTANSGSIVQSTAASLTTGALSLQATAATLQAPGNQIATLSSATTSGDLTIVNGRTLTVTGPVSAATLDVTTSAGDLAVNSSLFVTNLAVHLAGALTENGSGQVFASSLTGSAASVALTGNNVLSAIGPFTATNDFTLNNGSAFSGTPLAVTGPLSAGSINIVNAGPVTLSGVITAATTASITATSSNGGESQTPATDGTITQTGGSLTAAAVALTAGDAFLQSAGSITATGTGGTVAIASHGALTIDGLITAAATSLTASNRVIDADGGTQTIPGVINGTSAGAIVGGLSGSSATTVDLEGNGNQVGTLAGFTSDGGFRLATGGSLNVVGPVTDTQTVALRADALQLSGTVTAPVVNLTAAGAITQPGGSVQASSLLSGSGSSVSLQQRANAVAGLGAFTSTGDFTLTDSAATLSVVGPVSVGNGHALTLMADSVSFTPAGSLSAPGGLVALQEFTPGAGVTLGSGGSLGTTPPITAATLQVGTAAGGPVTITAAFNLPTVGALNLQSASAITETGQGAVSVPVLEGAGQSATLNGENRITSLAGFTVGSGFSLFDNGPLTVNGPVAGSTVSLTTFSQLTLAGNVTAPAGLTLGGNPIVQTGGSLTTGRLTLDDHVTTLASPGNAIGALAGFNGPSLTLVDSIPLTVANAVGTGTLSLTAPSLTVSARVLSGPVSLTANGSVAAGQGFIALNSLLSGSTVLLTANGLVSGSVSAATLDVNAAAASLRGNVVQLGASTATTGDFTLTDTGPLAVTGAVTGPTLVSLSAGPGVTVSADVRGHDVQISSANGANGPVLQTAGAINGDTVSIVASGPFSQTGGSITGTTSIGIYPVGSLTLSGTVNGGDVTLGSPNQTGGGGTITQPGGTLTANVLSVFGSSAVLTQPGNAVGALDQVSVNGTFQLASTRTVTVDGFLDAGQTALSVSGGDLVLSGGAAGISVSSLALNVSGVVSDPPGSIVVLSGALTGSAGTLDLANPVSVGTLGAFHATNGLTLASSRDLTVLGPVSDGTAVTLSSMGPMTLAGNVNAPVIGLSAADLRTGQTIAPGSITQTGGTVAATTGALTVAAAGPLTQQAGALSGSTVALSSGGALTLGGTLSGGAVSLVAVTRTDAGPAGNQTAPGTISQTGGTITATTLSGSSGSTTTLAQGGNAIAGLGGFGSSGGFTLATSQGLTVTGPVVDTASISLTTAGALALNGIVQAPAVTLDAGGAITQGSGGVFATTLAGQATSVALTGGNQVYGLGTFTATGDFALSDGVPLTIAGVTMAGAGKTLTIADTMPTFAAGGLLAAPGGTVVLTAGTAGGGLVVGGPGLTGASLVNAAVLQIGSPTAGAVVIAGGFDASGVPVLSLQSAGAISQTGPVRANTLLAQGGSVALTDANQFANLGPSGATTSFAVSDMLALAVTGPVMAGTTGSLASQAGLTLAGDVTAPTSLTLTSRGAIQQTAGTLTTGLLTGSSTGTTTLAGNVAGLGAFTSSGGFTLTTGSLVVTGPVSDGTAITLGASGSLTLAGTLTTGALRLTALAGPISQSGGALVAGSLALSGPAISLPGANQVGTLGPVTTPGAFTLNDTLALTVAGPVQAGGNVTLGSRLGLTLAGAVAGDTVTLASGGALLQTGGSLTANTLTGSSMGTTVLTAPGNAVTVLGGFASNGGFSLTTRTGLSVSGPLNDPAAITLSAGGQLALSGTVTTGALSLVATGPIVQPGGTIAAASLTGSAASLSLTAANQIGALGPFSAAADFALGDAVPLTIAGGVQAGQGHALTVMDAVINFGPAGTLTAPGGTVALQEFTPGTGLTIGGGSGLAGNPLVSAATLEIGRANGGPVTIAAPLNLASAGTLDLESAGAIGEAGTGALRVAFLTGNGGSAGLTGPNQIGTLGAFTTTAGFALTNAQGLTIAGPVSDRLAATIAAAGPLTVTGGVSAPAVLLRAAGDLTQAAGTLAATNLTLTSTGGAISLTGGAATGDATAVLNAAGPISLSNTLTAGILQFNTPGSVQQGGGKLVVGTLNGASGGAISLGQSGVAQVGAVGLLASPVSISLTDGLPLVLGGTVAAPVTSIAATGRFVLAGGALLTNDGSVLTVFPDANGLAAFVQTGTTAIAGYSGGLSGLRIALPGSGGSVALNNLAAPTTALVMSLGNGSATGAVTLASLSVFGTGGGADLTGTVAGQGGFAAAQLSNISPQVDLRYTLNGCALAAVSCGDQSPSASTLVLSATIASVLRPDILALDVLDLSVTRDQADPTLQLPNISDRDY